MGAGTSSYNDSTAATYTNYSNYNSDPIPDGKRFVRRLKKDGSGFDMVEEDDLPGRTGGQRRNKKRSKAAKKARKRNRS